MKILNLTQHPATADQKEQGVIDYSYREELQQVLTFDAPPTQKELEKRAERLAAMAAAYPAAMIGGAPYFMAPLEKALKRAGIKPVYSFSARESVEEVQADGTVVKRAVFRHVAFVGLDG